MLHIGLPTLTSVASDLLNHALNELSAWAATCLSRSVTEVTTKASTGATHSLIKMASFQGAYILNMSVLIPLNFLYDIVKSVFLFAHVWLCRSGIMWRRYIPRLLDCFPYARSAMEHAHLIIPIWDMQPRNIGIHRRHTLIRDRQMKHARPICKGECDTGLCTNIDDVLHRV